MPEFTVSLSDGAASALDWAVAQANSGLAKDAVPWTPTSYLQDHAATWCEAFRQTAITAGIARAQRNALRRTPAEQAALLAAAGVQLDERLFTS